MEIKDTVANTSTTLGAAAYIMQWQGELTVLLLLTGLLLNITRLYDWFKTKNSKDEKLK